MKTKYFTFFLCSIFLLGGVISSPEVRSQTPQFRIPIIVVDSIFGNSNNLKKVRRDTLQFGLHSGASFCLDYFWMTDFQDHWFYSLGSVIDSQKAKEVSLPPWGVGFEARLFNPPRTPACLPGQTGLGLGVKANIHQYLSSTQTDTFKLILQTDPTDTVSKVSFEWPSVLNEYCTSMRLKYSSYINRDMLTTTKWSVPVDSLSIFPYYYIIMSGPKVPPGPPAPVQLVSPTQEQIDIPTTVTLQWNAPTSAYYYRLQFSKDSTFATRIFDDTLRTTSRQFSGLQGSSWYYWRVNVTNQYGVSLFQSPAFKFRTVLTLIPPVPIYPLNNTTDVPMNPLFQWRSIQSASAVTYRVQVANDIAFSSVVKDVNVTDTTTMISGLQYCTSYYWRINASNSEGTSDWSLVMKFTMIYSTPAVPTLNQPANNAVDVPLSTTLSWTSSDICTQNYRIQVAKDTNFLTLVFNSTTTQTSQPISGLEQGTNYYWHVKALNSVDSSAYTAYRKFTTVILPPSTPVLVSPANGDTTQNPAVTIVWRSTLYTNFYHLQIATDQNFTSLVFNDSTLTDTFKVTNPLTNCTNYYWRVRSKNVAGASSFSSVRNFKIKPSTPLIPTLVSPADNQEEVPLTPTLSWTAGDICSYTYRIQLAKDSNFSQVVIDVRTNSTSYTISSNLDQDTFYYWKVKSLNWIDSSQFTEFRKFKTSILPPSAPPQLISPTNGYGMQDAAGTLLWRKTALTTSYHLQISTIQNFSTLVFSDSAITDTFKVTSPLTPCVTYYWRVASKNRGGSSSFSSAWSFVVRPIAPSAPTLVSPVDNATSVALNPTLSWTSTDICSYGYRLEVAKDINFSTIVTSVSTTQTSQQIGPLTLDTEYYWHVKSGNPVDSSSFSPTWKFRTILNPPSTPQLVSPAIGDTNQAPDGKLVWRKDQLADTYYLQIATDAVFTSKVVDDSTLTDTSYTTSALTNCKTYYWKVRAKNGAGVSNFSSAWNFKVRAAIPSTVTLVSPFDTQNDLSQMVRLIWMKADLCTQRYFYQVSRNSGFTDIVTSGETSDTTKLIGPLAGKEYYYWHVQAINYLGAGPFSPTWQFYTTRSTPPAPALLAPPNGALDQPSTVVLQWDSTTFAVSYRVQVALDQNFTNLKVNDSTILQQPGVLPSKTVSGLLNSTTYYWRVNAKNELGTSGWSQVWNFVTLYPPAAPTLNRPYNGEMEVSVTPMFDWSIAQRAEFYRLEVSEDTLFSKKVFDDSTLSILNWPITTPLKGNTKYFWRVRGKNSVGWGPYSPIYHFKTTHSGTSNWTIPLTITETGPAFGTIYFGVHPSATAGVDVALGEFTLPPVDPWYFDARFVSPYIGEGLFIDIVKFYNYHQVDTFQFTFQPTPLLGSYPVKISWPKQLVKSICDSMVIKDQLTSPTIRARMDIDSFLTVSTSSIRSLYIVSYGAFPLPLGVKPIKSELPKGYVLYQNYPNPFNPTTNLTFSTDKSAKILIKIYDVLGREVVTIADAAFYAGQYTLQWNGKDENGIAVPSGVYYLRMIAQSLSVDGSDGKQFVSTRKMLMVK